MILTALKELAHAEQLMADPDYEPKPVSWAVELAENGAVLGFVSLRQPDAKGKPRPITLVVPKIAGRTSGVSAQFLYDKCDYVLGFTVKKDGTVAQTDRQLDAAIEVIREAHAQTQDTGLAAVQRFLERQRSAAERGHGLPDDFDPGDWLVFRLAGDIGFVHERPAARAWWHQARATGGVATAMCLITGQPCLPVDKHDAIKKVPGGSTSGVALVSFNTDAFESYALERNANAPVSREAAEAYVRALNRLLDPRYPHPAKAGEVLPPRVVRLGADTAVVFWTANPAHPFGDDVFDVFDAPKPELVRDMLAAPHTGKGAYLEDVTPFYALTLSGGQGRATIRDWFTSSVGDMAERIRAWFEDLALAFPFEHTPPPALKALLRSTVLEGKDANIAPNLAANLLQAVLRNSPLPLTLLHAALRRCKAEGPLSSRATGEVNRTERSHLRMQLIKAVLLRLRRQRGEQPFEEELTMLDENCKEPGYVLGRLFAVLESLQYAAQGRTNVTIGDRYYGAASSTPNAVFPLLERLSRHHLHKLRGERRGQAVNLEKRKGAVMDLLPAQPFPSVLAMEEQGLFALGYYHQRQAQFRSGEGQPAEDDAGESPDQA